MSGPNVLNIYSYNNFVFDKICSQGEVEDELKAINFDNLSIFRPGYVVYQFV